MSKLLERLIALEQWRIRHDREHHGAFEAIAEDEGWVRGEELIDEVLGRIGQLRNDYAKTGNDFLILSAYDRAFGDLQRWLREKRREFTEAQDG